MDPDDNNFPVRAETNKAWAKSRPNPGQTSPERSKPDPGTSSDEQHRVHAQLSSKVMDLSNLLNNSQILQQLSLEFRNLKAAKGEIATSDAPWAVWLCVTH
jgi:hypothetical protein